MTTIPGFSFLMIALLLIFMTVCYYACPRKYLNKKYEYVKFFLVFFSCYFLIIGIIGLTPLGYNNATGENNGSYFFLFFLSPTLFLSHWLYKFKTVKKSQNLSFFLFFATLYFFVGLISVAALYALSGGMD